MWDYGGKGRHCQGGPPTSSGPFLSAIMRRMAPVLQRPERTGPAPVLELGRTGLLRRPSPGQVEALRREFEAQDFVRLPGLLAPELLQTALDKLSAARFDSVERIKNVIRAEHAPRELDCVLSFCFQHSELFAFVESVTGCRRIRSFEGRVLRLRPVKSHFLAWHRDTAWDDRRLVALSINVGPEPFSGGVLQFRRPGSRQPTSQIANTTCGDAVLFRGSVPHRNTPVSGARPKLSFSGWFYCDRPGGELAMFTRRA